MKMVTNSICNYKVIILYECRCNLEFALQIIFEKLPSGECNLKELSNILSCVNPFISFSFHTIHAFTYYFINVNDENSDHACINLHCRENKELRIH